MGYNDDDMILLTKFIRQSTINLSHKQLAQTIFTTPNIALGRAISLFEKYNPSTSSTSTSDTNYQRSVISLLQGKRPHVARLSQEKRGSHDQGAEKS